jgi:hypothetical protein
VSVTTLSSRTEAFFKMVSTHQRRSIYRISTIFSLCSHINYIQKKLFDSSTAFLLQNLLYKRSLLEFTVFVLLAFIKRFDHTMADSQKTYLRPLRFLALEKDPSSIFENTTFTNTTGHGDENGVDFSTDDEITSSEFDPRVFWAVNGLLFFMMATMAVWCCFGKKDWLTNAHRRRAETDETFQRGLRERHERKEALKVDSPAKRKEKLLQSFRRHQVQMVRMLLYSLSDLIFSTTIFCWFSWYCLLFYFSIDCQGGRFDCRRFAGTL